MSKETEPIRSRRQLREQSAQPAGAQAVPAAPASSVPVSPAPAAPGPAAPPQDAAASGEALPAAPGHAPAGTDAPAPRERQSQTRARDRAALRAYKELIDPPGLSPLPSRKALRQAQIDADRAPITAVNPVVSISAKPSGSPKTQQSPVVAQSAESTAGHPGESADENAAAPAAEIVQESGTTPRPQAVPAAATVPALRTRAGRRAAPATRSSSSPGTAQPAKQRPSSTPPENGVPEAGGSDAATAEAAAPATAGTANPQPDSIGPDLVAENSAQAEADAETSLSQGARPPAAKLPSPPAAKPGSGAVPTVAPAAVELQGSGIPETAGQPAAWANDMDGNVPHLPGLVPGGDYYPISAGPPVAPSTEELKVLAAKRAEAERAAILAERAKARERLAQESAKNRRPASDPTATNNLAMVTPLEFIDVPGMDRPVLRPPATTHVPIVTHSTPRQLPAAPARPATGRTDAAQSPAGAAGTAAATNGEAAPQHGAPSPTVPNISAERFDAALAARAVHRPGPGNRPLTGGRSSTLKRAEEMAGVAQTVPADGSGAPKGAGVQAGRAVTEAVPVQRSQMPPMPADYAHGLEPLDAMTAGLGRTQRNLLILWGSIILGGAALVACALMVLSNIFN